MDLLSLQDRLGYKVNEKGMCYGITYMAIQAIIRNEVKTYISRIKLIDSYEKNIIVLPKNHNILNIDNSSNVTENKQRNPLYQHYSNLSSSDNLKLFDIKVQQQSSDDISSKDIKVEWNKNELYLSSYGMEINRERIAIEVLVADIKAAYEKRKNLQTRYSLTPQDEKLLDILAWFDGVQLYFNDTHLEDNVKLTANQDYRAVTNFFKTKDEQKKPLARTNRFRKADSIHSENHFKKNAGYESIVLKSKHLDFLSKELVQWLIDKINKSIQPIAFSITIFNHIIAIGKSRSSPIFLINHDRHYIITKETAFNCINEALFPSRTFNAYNAISILEFSSENNSRVLSTKFKVNFEDHREVAAIGDILHLALSHNHQEAVIFYVNLINAKSATTNKQRLLAARSPNFTPGLYMALRNGHAEAIKVYLEALTNTGINKQELLDLLFAKDADGTSGLYMAILKEQVNAILGYFEALTNTGINKQQLLDLLTTQNTDNTADLLAKNIDEVKNYIRLKLTI
ncbi:hypothetical protein EDC55_12324 [Allofrancisella inopinata]|uniref:Ankyrin repeat protein n=1 Tax=Allofrancisella inopinata TaxID=1085647 RepID=A0AAE6YHD2_9GAMM|nr:hypothetical protein [Allofrancisella inopinata]QIV95646.1 hypothetical protein E4K63_01875 [Allofrancisella inopinata]TDT67474.1 hypothetical protein EDC55_12324 [Allofrancisella inopinata]